jgi:hypothetical protein
MYLAIFQKISAKWLENRIKIIEFWLDEYLSHFGNIVSSTCSERYPFFGRRTRSTLFD